MAKLQKTPEFQPTADKTRKKKQATQNAGTITEDIAHEVVQAAVTPAAAPTIQDTVKNEIAKFSLPDTRIDELKKQFSGLTIASIEDTKGYNIVKEARATVRKLRTGIENKRKELKADYLETGRAIDGEASRLTKLLLEVEEPLDAEIKRIDEVKEKIKREADEAAQRQIQSRVAMLLDNGVSFNGAFYTIGETVSIDVVALRNFTEEQFEALISRVKTEAAAILQAERLKAEQAQAEAQRLQEQKEAQEAERLALEKEKAQQEKERQAIENERRQMRAEKLEGYGIFYRGSIKGWAFGSVVIGENQLGTLDAEIWDKSLREAEEFAAQQKKEQTAKAEAEQKRLSRITEMQNIGYKAGPLKFFLLTESFGQSNFYEIETAIVKDEAEWTAFVKEATAAANETRRQDAEQKANSQRQAEREKEIEAIGLSFNFYAGGWIYKSIAGDAFKITTEQVKNASASDYSGAILLAKQFIENDNFSKKEKAEIERIARLSDVEKAKEFSTNITAALRMPPKVEDYAVASALGAFLNAVSDAHIRFDNVINKL